VDVNRLIGLVIVFAPLSILSFGGGQAIVADMQHQTVGVWGWMTPQQFSDIYGIARAAPGPSSLIAALVGYQVAGFLGAIVACVAIFAPSSVVLYATAAWWQNHPDSRLKRSFERGLGPVAIGLLFAGALAIIEAVVSAGSAAPIWLTLATIIAVSSILYLTKISPYWLILLVGVIYLVLKLLIF
jgi:chromate transporter